MSLDYFTTGLLRDQQWEKLSNGLLMNSATSATTCIHPMITFSSYTTHLNILVPEQYQDTMAVCDLPPYSPFLNPTEQAHSCFKVSVKQQLTGQQISRDLGDEVRRLAAQITSKSDASRSWWVGQSALNSITVQKCINWCDQVARYMPACLLAWQCHYRLKCISVLLNWLSFLLKWLAFTRIILN